MRNDSFSSKSSSADGHEQDDDDNIGVQCPLFYSKVKEFLLAFVGEVSTSNALKPLERTLSSLINLRHLLRPHLHLVAPALCKLILALEDVGAESQMWQSFCIRALQRIYSRGALLEYPYVASRIVHCLTHVISSATFKGLASNSIFFQECISALCALGRQLGQRFLTFDRLIRSTITNQKFSIVQYDELIAGIKSGQFEHSTRYAPISYNGGTPLTNSARLGELASNASDMDLYGAVYNSPQGIHLSHTGANSAGWRSESFGQPGPAKLPLNQQQLQRAWDVTQRSTSNDWFEVQE